MAGVAANLLGIDDLCRHNVIFKEISQTLDSLGSVTTPLIFIVTGYGIQLERAYVKPAIKLLLIRYAVLFSVAYLVKILILDRVIGEVTPLYNMAFFTYMILPPPYSSAIFISLYSTPENTYVTNNVLVMSTVMAVAVLSLAALVVPL